MAKAPSKPAAPALQGADNYPAGNDPAGGVVQTPTENPPAQAEDSVPQAREFLVVVRVRALQDGFRRAGVAWSAQAQEVWPNQFTPEEFDALCAEPMLVVEYITREV